jgi:hypothetical protein
MNLKAVVYFLIPLLVSAQVDDLRASSAFQPSKDAALTEDGAFAPTESVASNEDGAYLPAPRQPLTGRAPKRGVPPIVPAALPSLTAPVLPSCTNEAAATPRPLCLGSCLYVFMALLR